MKGIVVADSSSLIIFAKTPGLEVLVSLFSEVWIPPEVLTECTRIRNMPGVDTIHEAVETGLIKLKTDFDVSVVPEDIRSFIDPGEIEAIALALADPHKVLITDDSDARSAAKSLGLVVVRSGGVLVEAKNEGKIASVAPILDEWVSKHDFLLSDSARTAILAKAGESPFPEP